MYVVIEKQNGSRHANTKVVETILEGWAWILDRARLHALDAHDPRDVQVWTSFDPDEIGVTFDSSNPHYWADWRYRIIEMI